MGEDRSKMTVNGEEYEWRECPYCQDMGCFRTKKKRTPCAYCVCGGVKPLESTGVADYDGEI